MLFIPSGIFISLVRQFSRPDSHVSSHNSGSKRRTSKITCLPHPYAESSLIHSNHKGCGRGCGLLAGDFSSRCHPWCYLEQEALYAQIEVVLGFDAVGLAYKNVDSPATLDVHCREPS